MMSDITDEKLQYMARRSELHRRRFYARQPKKLADVMAQLVAKRGYSRQRSDEQLQAVWKTAAGPALAKFSRAIAVRRGRLEVLVSSSTMMQELSFARGRIVAELQQKLPEAKIEDLKLRVGRID